MTLSEAKRLCSQGQQKLAAGDLQGAIASYDQALQYEPNDSSAWSNRGLALTNLGLWEEAIASFDQALQHKPDDPQTWCNQGTALASVVSIFS